MSKRPLILTALWIIAFVVALSLDAPIASWVHNSGFGKHVEGTRWAQVIKEPGEFRFTILVAVLLLVAKQIQWRQAVFVLLSGIVSGVNFLVKWIVGRSRPYKIPGTSDLRPLPFELHPFWHGLYGLFHQRDLCFPSGHECTAAALATAIFLTWRPGAWMFIVLAILVGIERPAENAHYASDVIGAVGFASLGTTLLHKALAGWLKPAQKLVET
jgi:membrane-associated phospholipid phosphatase